MKAIIFGANGQDGFYLSKLLVSKNIEVIGVSRKGNWTIGDVSNFNLVNDLIKIHKPDYIYHLAAVSSTNHSSLFENHNTICDGTLNILEAVKNHSFHSKVFISGSAMQFENSGLPINESTPFEASSAYSISRIHTVYAARYYRSLGLKVYVGYFFNHESPYRSENHMSKKISSFALKIKNGFDGQLEIGDISVEKEWNFAGDSMNAISILINQDIVHEAVIGNGQAYSIKYWTDLCFSSLGLNWKDYIIENSLFKPEYKVLVSDPKVMLSLGWRLEVSINDLAKMMLKSIE